VPIAGSSRIPVRFHLWVSLAVAALAAVGVDRLDRGFPVRLRVPGLLALYLVLFAIPILLYVYAPALSGSGRWNLPYHVARFSWLRHELTAAGLRSLALGVLGGALIVTAVRTRASLGRTAASGAFPLVILADLFGSHWYDVPTIDPRYWTAPPQSAQILARDPRFTRVFGIADRHSGEPGFASEPVDFFASRDTLDWSLPPVWGLASARGETPIISRRLLAYTDHARVGGGRFEIESVSHLVTGRRIVSFASALALGEPIVAGAATVRRNMRSQPRARLVGRPYYANDEAGAIRALDTLGPEIRNRLVVEDPDRPLATDALVEGQATITRDEPERVMIDTSSDRPAYLVLADTYDPGWQATLDGRPAPIRPAWVAFRAVFVPAGTHVVVFTYRPAGFATGLAISLGSIVVACVLLLSRCGFPAARPAHDQLAWPERWPRRVFLACLILVGLSAVGWDTSGRPKLSARWHDSFHQFTWGAGIEAMRSSPK
jgi:hypothetical protein